MILIGANYRCVLGVLGAALLSTAFVMTAVAQQAPQLPVDEDARLALIDHCVLDESARGGQYDNVADRCKCATKAIMSQMSQSEMQAVAKWRKPTSALKTRWQQASDACG
ncbi:hypothetical protein [Microbaculum marinum]|uniref:Uncharacterized protein n=1 Tax=Microbaculum marinum TaxID=1764581 RepID=A0AAW9RT10_9HYPH